MYTHMNKEECRQYPVMSIKGNEQEIKRLKNAYLSYVSGETRTRISDRLGSA
jgi:hypothetical protein